MLAPDVWNFPVPKNIITYRSGRMQKKTEVFLNNFIKKHPFNEIVSILLPEEKSIPSKIVEFIQETDHYTVKKIRVGQFVQRSFIEGFIKKGEFTGFSCNVSTEFEDCFAITPDGVLIISISKELYQSLGLEGHPVSKSKYEEKYIIEINLKRWELENGVKNCNKIKNALSSNILPEITFQFIWKPSETNICPSSAAKYFNDIGYKIELCQTKIKSHQAYGLKFPKLLPEIINDADFVHEFVESVGMALLSCDAELDPNLCTPSSIKCENEVEAKILHCKGLLSTDFITKLFSELRSYISQSSLTTWVAMYVHGYQYSPKQFYNQDHVFSCNGDNGFLLVLYPNDYYLLYQNVSSNKTIK